LDLGFSGYPLRQNHTGGWFQLSSAIYRWWFGDDRFLNGESHNPIQSLVGGLEPWNFRTFHILGMSSSQLIFIVFRGVDTTNQLKLKSCTVNTHRYAKLCQRQYL
jgi:hypothetical protein